MDIERFDDESFVSFSEAIEIDQSKNETFRRAFGALGNSGEIILDTYARNAF